MHMTEKEFKKSMTSKERRLYLELALSEMLDIDFDSIHNQIIVYDPSIVNDPDIPISKRPDCTILTFADRIVILFKNNSIEEKCSPIVYEITEKISSKNPDKLIAAINFNEFEN